MGFCLASPLWGQYTLRLEARPEQIPADGISTSTITAVVLDSANREAPDGTLVIFQTTAGRLSTLQGRERETLLQVPTQAGRARVLLISETQEVTAEVSARLVGGRDVTLLSVRFGSGTSPGSAGERALRIGGRYLRYNPEQQLVEVMGEAVWSYRGLTIQAHALQYNLARQVVRARGLGNGVEVRHQGQRLVGDRLYYSALQEQGVLLMVSNAGVQRVGFRGPGLQVMPQEGDPPPEAFAFETFEEERLWVRAKEMALLPGHRTVFREARFYMGGTLFLSLPYYVEEGFYSVPQQFQFVGYSSYYGLVVDFPYYLDVKDTSSLALKLVRGQPAGFYSRQRGFSLQLVGEYRPRPEIEGSLVLDRLPRRDFDVYLDFHHQFGPRGLGRWDVYLDWAEHRHLNLRSNVVHPWKQGSLYLEWNMSQWGLGGASQWGQIAWRVYGQRIPRWRMAYGGSLFLRYMDHPFGPPIVEHGLSMDLYPPTWALTPRTGLSGRVSLQYARDSRQQWQRGLSASATLQHRLNATSTLSLGYTWDDQTGSRSLFPRREGLNLTFSGMAGQRWYGYLYASQDLRGNGALASGSLSLWVHPLWRIGVRGMYQDYRFGTFSDYEFSLGRRLGGREVQLVWSSARHRFMVELGMTYF